MWYTVAHFEVVLKAIRWIGRGLFAAVLVWCGLTEGVQLFSRMFFHTWVAGDWFLIFLASDGEEFAKFIQLNEGFFALCVAALVLGVGLALASLFLSRKGWWILFGVFCLYAAWGFARYGAVWTPAFLAYDTAYRVRDYGRLVREGLWTDEDEALCQAARRDPKTAALPTLVLVIGESTTPSRMGIYGYAKDTTPELAVLATNGLDVLPPREVSAGNTGKALIELLVKGDASFVRRMRRKGYHPVLISAQAHWERYGGVEQMVFASCEKKVYLGDLGVAQKSDFALVGLAQDEFRSSERPLLLIVHMLGSHYPFSERYPSYWTKEEGWDDYDMSVLVTDSVVASIINALPKDAVLMFTSDHGESPNSAGWRDASDPDLFRVPMLIYPKGRPSFLE